MARRKAVVIMPILIQRMMCSKERQACYIARAAVPGETRSLLDKGQTLVLCELVVNWTLSDMQAGV